MKAFKLSSYFLALSNKWVFFILIITVFLITFITNKLILTDEFYYLSLGDQFSIDHIASFLNKKDKFEFLHYILIPAFYLLKFLAISCVLLTAMIVAGLKLTFKDAFKIAIIAEAVFILASVIKLIWLLFKQGYTFEDIQYFYPLSLITILNYDNIPELLVYPLQLLNLFEALYWLLLAWGLYTVLKKDYEQIDYKRSLKLVLSAYLPALFLWICLASFITVSIAP